MLRIVKGVENIRKKNTLWKKYSFIKEPIRDFNLKNIVRIKKKNESNIRLEMAGESIS